MATCKHGATEPHGEIGKDWCAGPPRSWYFEAFRDQLEEQMNLDTTMFTRFAEAQEIDASQVPTDINEPFIIPGAQTARMSSYAIPTTTDVDEAMRHGVGLWQIHAPTSAEFIRSYEQPRVEQFRAAYARYAPAWSVVIDTLENFVPLGWYSPCGEHWYADTPIYDALVAERGDPFRST